MWVHLLKLPFYQYLSINKHKINVTLPLRNDCSPQCGFAQPVASAHTRTRTMTVHNVNAYTVARSHLRCLKNRTENRRPIYRAAPAANVNMPSCMYC